MELNELVRCPSERDVGIGKLLLSLYFLDPALEVCIFWGSMFLIPSDVKHRTVVLKMKDRLITGGS